MTYQEANSISIKDYLESLGILPVVDKLYYGMYHSPLRQDDTPSFKVDYGVNLWCDFGTGEGGSLIDLVMKQYGCNTYGAISRLEQDYYSANTFSFQGKNIPEKNPAREERKRPASPVEIRSIQPLQHPALTNYLKSRGIAPEVAADYVQEMYYREAAFCARFQERCRRVRTTQSRLQGLHLSQRHHTHTVCRKEKRCLFRVRGIYGLPFFPNHPAQEQPDLSLYRLAGLHHPELDRQCG